MGTTTFSGPVVSENGFVGDVTGTDATATTTTAGLVKQAAKVPEAAGAAPTDAEFDALIAALVAAGIMAAA